ncbi:hypothetical protein JAK51_18345 [Stenotrophomonas maltophilia]|uniref:hypothetical protein n=2 Tax=Gammaproteobacteria TaxID=1236 RepID=UPI0021C93F92|nr:hypothetical protein [Stenotrophomonas maltophilia]MCU1128164.1 hypothetical protein [Stenotrophomonas maltophilia]
MSNWLDLLERAKATDPQSFAVYLQGLHSQWSLDERDEASTRVLQALRARQAPMNLSAAAALYQAFGWDEEGCGPAPGELRELAEHAWQDWLQLPAQIDMLAQQMEARGGRWTSHDDAASRLRQLREPRSHLHNLMSALPLRVPRQAAALMDLLGCQEDRPVPPGIDPGQARFWAGASDVTYLPAAQLSLLRALLASLVLTLVAFIALGTTQIASMLLPYQSEEQRRAIVLGTAVLAPLLGTLLAIGLRHLFVWQSAPEEPSLPPSWLRWLTLPVACAAIAAAGTTVYLWVPSPSLWLAPLCWLLAWTVLTTAWIRYQLRRGKPVRMALPVSFLVMLSVLSVLPALLGTLLLWSMDLFRYRQRLRRS